VLIDLVLSHCADTHPWFQSCLQGRGSPHDDAFIWADPAPDGGPPNNWLSVFGGSAWTYNEVREQYYLHNFLKSQPDLNYHTRMVRDEALSIARYWLDKGVDGFRLDAINFCLHDTELRDNPKASAPDGQCVQLSNPYGTMLHVFDKNHAKMPGFLEELRTVMDGYDDRVTIGEIGASQEQSQVLMSAYTKPGRLNLCYSFDLLSSPLDAHSFRQIIDRLGVERADSWACWSMSNHDVVRAPTRLSSTSCAPETVTPLSLALLLSFRGTPCLYQGEELGLEEVEVPYEQLVDPYGIAFYPEFKGRDGCRTPMPWDDRLPHSGFCPDSVDPWLPIPAHHRMKALNRAREEPGSVYQLLRELLIFRKTHLSLSIGSIRVIQSDSRLLVFERQHATECMICAFNLSPESVEIDRPGGWSVLPGIQRGVSQPHGEARLLMDAWSWYIQRVT
jgi:alpha-glucosidase